MAAATPQPTPLPPARVTIAFVGDLMIDRRVEIAMAVEGPEYTLERVTVLFEEADLVVGNLEGTLSVGGTPMDKRYTFQTDPELAIPMLLAGGIDAVSLANNHTTDFGITSLEQTIAVLDGAGIHHWGAHMTEASARAARHVSVPAAGGDYSVSIRFLGYNDFPQIIFAAGDQAGVARATVDSITEAVARVRGEASGDFIVVTIHGGDEYSHVVNDRQRSFAYAAIDAGADLVVGHHPHVLQPIEVYKDRLILHSLGNFVFDLDAEDMEFLGEGPFQSVVALVTFEVGRHPTPADLELRPARIDVVENRPRPATAEEAEGIITLLAPPEGTVARIAVE